MQTNSFGNRLKNFIISPSVLNRLIVINIIVFLLVNLLNLIYKLGNIQPATFINGFNLNELIYFLALPADLHSLATRPWTIFTYMFLHEQLFHIFFNMFMLFVGGQMFIYFFSEKKLLSIYLLGGILGAAFYIIAFNIFPGFILIKSRAIAMGASASVLAVVFAIITRAPNYETMLFFLFKIKLKYIALIFIVIDLFSIIGDNPGGGIAHLGGALCGFLFALPYRNNSKFTFNINFSKITSLFKRKRRKMKAEYSERPHRPLSDEEYNRMKADNQKRIDAILDKISQSGYKSLSSEEKEFLFKFGKKN